MRELYFFAFILLFGLGGCSSQKKLKEPAGFTVLSSSCYKLLPGREESGSQLILEVYISEIPSGIQSAEVLFRDQVKKYSISTKSGKPVLTAVFSPNGPEKPDIVMHADSAEEAGNQPPTPQPLLKEFPFELQKDEAVFRYKEGDKYTYFKVGAIREGETKAGI